MSHTAKMPRGGKREGAGRKVQAPPGAKQWNILVTEEEKKQIKALLEQIRKPSA
jgi:hypothetical protein